MNPKINTFLQLSAVAAALALTSCGRSDSAKAPEPAKPEPAKPVAAEPAAPGNPAPAFSKEGQADPASPPKGYSEADLVEITPEYPKPLFSSAPVATSNIANLEKADPEAEKRRLTFKLPKGTQNVALRKKVTSSDPLPIIGSLNLITDGDMEGSKGSYVELASGKQWVQIDLGQSYSIWKLLVWHSFQDSPVYLSVVVQISDDRDFKTYTTVYNSDAENALGFEAGKDKTYVETNHGRLIDANGTTGRYVRLWSKGNSADDVNRYVEVQVYGSK